MKRKRRRRADRLSVRARKALASGKPDPSLTIEALLDAAAEERRATIQATLLLTFPRFLP